jgi:hypothetical protein
MVPSLLWREPVESMMDDIVHSIKEKGKRKNRQQKLNVKILMSNIAQTSKFKAVCRTNVYNKS